MGKGESLASCYKCVGAVLKKLGKRLEEQKISGRFGSKQMTAHIKKSEDTEKNASLL